MNGKTKRKMLVWGCVALALPQLALAADVVTIHSAGAGQLEITTEALSATRLKVTGHIDARDFRTLKRVTMSITRELDLSEAVIEAYNGYDGGSYAPIVSDWFVGNVKPRAYPAHTIPIHAFTAVGDNSVYKWQYGSSSLTRLVLPAQFAGLDSAALYKNPQITELVVPEGSTTATGDGQAVYNADETELLAVAPACAEVLQLPPTVVSVARNALLGLALRGIVLDPIAEVDFGYQQSASVAYIVAPRGGDFSATFPDADVTERIDVATVETTEAGKLLVALGNAGWTRNDVRGIRVSGPVNADDVDAMLALPHLHHLDMSAADYNGSTLRISSQTLTELALPAGSYGLTIGDCPYLGGSLVVPEGVTTFDGCEDSKITSVSMPSTLSGFGSSDAFSSSLVHTADLSRCVLLTQLYAFQLCANLETLRLPPGLKSWASSAPLADVSLPSTLTSLSASNWLVERLTLPENLESVSLSRFLHLVELDASQANQLRRVGGLYYCPLLEEVDLSHCPITSFRGLSYSSLRSLKLPSTVQTIDGLENCHLLETLDLENCAALKSLCSLVGFRSLTTLRLPPDIEWVGDLSQCTALQHIYCAADKTAPSLPAISDAQITGTAVVHVPNGSRGLYAMSEGWCDFANIVESGYTVRVSTSRDGLPTRGTGLYPAGATAKIEAPATAWEEIIPYNFTQWNVGDIAYFANPASFEVAGHVDAVAQYEAGAPDFAQCDITFTLTVDSPVNLQLSAYDKDGYRVYNDHGLSLEGSKTDYNYLDLSPGTYHFGITTKGEPLNFMFYDISYSQSARLTDLKMREMPRLEAFNVVGLGLETVDFSGITAVTTVDVSGNDLRDIDLSGCPHLEELVCSRNKLTKLDLSNQQKLRDLRCYNNRITDIAFGNKEALEHFEFEMNSFGFSQIDEHLLNVVKDSYSWEFENFGKKEMEFVPPHELGTGDVLDLSRETESADGHPVAINFRVDNSAVPSEGGRYAIEKNGFYNLHLTCEALPALEFHGVFIVDGPSSGVDPLPIGGLSLEVEGLAVRIAGLPDGASATLYDGCGMAVASGRGTSLSLHAKAPGVHVVRMSDTQGRTAAVKVALK